MICVTCVNHVRAKRVLRPGCPRQATTEVSPGDVQYIRSDWNDRISSVWNLSSDQVCIYTDGDYRGYHWSIPAGATQELLFSYDNAVSSYSVSGCGG
ncbi:peptidase inhibitor family I36 protein [Streptomyces sp. B3I8]|uniref:peptidase inhibitor family I36 protein n=1 Tax=Streptomyces sp. B3I8 TaxID=3042303 RepID=UPI00278575F0|nr:peptidase inhibitor family I36 protein [Streptomyces sp. B3I8]MDQ0788125.1 hypothetical protein [Streptomyces sp. B3I8]